MFAASSSTPTSGTGSRPPGERLARCSPASHNAIAKAVTSPAELPRPSFECRYSVPVRLHEHGEVELRAAVGRSGSGDPPVDIGVSEKGEDLAGGAVHAAALLKRRVHVIEHGRGRQLEPVLGEDPRRLIVVRAWCSTGTPG